MLSPSRDARDAIEARSDRIIPEGPRRQLAMKGFGRLEDGTTFPLSLVDISYFGCRIRTEAALGPGVRFRLSTFGCRGSVEAEVRWQDDGQAGVEFVSGEGAAKPSIPRSRRREELEGAVYVRRPGGQRYKARLFDLTTNGCKVEFVERPRCGDRLWVKCPGLEAIEAKVAWVDGLSGGLKFVRPLHQAVFESLVSRLKPGAARAA